MPFHIKDQTRCSLMAIALLLALPAATDQAGSSGAATAPVTVTAAPAPTLDPRARDAWVRECRRRMGYDYDYGDQPLEKKKKRKSGDVPRESGYDYCQAYFDDYYRNQRQSAAPAATIQASQPGQSVREVVTEDYVSVPARRSIRKLRRPSRAVPRRAVND